MTNQNSSPMGKIVNPNLALAAMHPVEPYGEFVALIKMTESNPPPCEAAQLYAPNLWKALIPCDRIDDLVSDTNVISIELREHIA